MAYMIWVTLDSANLKYRDETLLFVCTIPHKSDVRNSQLSVNKMLTTIWCKSPCAELSFSEPIPSQKNCFTFKEFAPKNSDVVIKPEIGFST